MRLHELPGDPGRQQKIKRVGRGEGSGHGKTSGKGHKGRQARSGGPKRGAFEGGQMPLIRRIPKFGFTNPFRVEYEVVNLTMLDKTFSDGDTVGVEELRKARLVRTNKPVKVLGHGSLTRKLKVTVHAYSQSAKDKIVSAGGSADTL